MLNAVIRFALTHRLLVAVLSLLVLGYGGWVIYELPIDVFPDLNRPRVVVITEAPGMAPEEVEALITFPLESSLNGANNVQAVRSSSGVGLSVIYVEFDWGTDIYTDRQIVNERVALAAERLPPNITPQLAPISSLLGQIMVIGMWSDGDETSPMELRTMADWVVRQRLLTIEGISQVFVMGGERKQFQVLVNPESLLQYGVTLHDVETAVQESNQNSNGGYLDEQGPHELLVRAIGRIKSIDDLRDVVVTMREDRPVLLRQIARVVEGPQVKRGDSSAFTRNAEGEFEGGPAVVLTVTKQPHADTREITKDVTEMLAELSGQTGSLPADVRVEPALYQQKDFIDRAIENVAEALRDGGILVVIILFVFLLNFRTTFITLTAIPLSIVVTALIFRWFGLSINTMTLGGLAVAIGELVDDAIVDVENIFRRLKENSRSANPQSALLVVFRASVEIRNSIVFGTLIVVLVFVPLFALSGMEGKLFVPMGVAYIVSILSSLLVSLTVTPVLSYWLLPKVAQAHRERENWLVNQLKRLAGATIRFSVRRSPVVLTTAVVAVAASAGILMQLERDFLPPFNEGSVQINALLPPGTSLDKTNEVMRAVENRLQQVPEIHSFVRKTGRAELDEHAEGVNVTEIVATLDPEAQRGREEILEQLREALDDVPGVVIGVEQPLAHLISHMLSGVMAEVAIKLYGDDLETLRTTALEMEHAIKDIEGIEDLMVEQQVTIPQLRIEPEDKELVSYGLRRQGINHVVETAMNGRVVSEVLIGQRSFDLLVRMDEPYREDLDALRRLTLQLPDGGTTSLNSVARIYRAGGPNTINREHVRRRIVLQCNVSGRGLVDVVEEIEQRLAPIQASLPPSYFIEYGGQFESQQSASRTIIVLMIISLVGIFLVLEAMFQSANLSLQIMISLPMAFIGAVAALYVTGQTLTVASMVGFISLCGIASRNGILLINHYLHLVRYEGESLTPDMLVRAGQERLSPVLMTALTSGIGLVPLALAAGQPGKEILYPVATVIIGGLITSTLLEFLVRPALFWAVGRGAAQQVIARSSEKVPLVAREEVASDSEREMAHSDEV
ncbi:MAG: efflux RND transporter permease subunit [Pirellulales bacterium]